MKLEVVWELLKYFAKAKRARGANTDRLSCDEASFLSVKKYQYFSPLPLLLQLHDDIFFLLQIERRNFVNTLIPNEEMMKDSVKCLQSVIPSKASAI